MLTAQPPAALGRSWLRSLPAGASVLSRDVLACTVMAVDEDWFSARVPGERRRRTLDPRLVTDEDRALRAGRESDQDVIKKLRARLAELEQPRGRRRRTSP